MIYYAQEARDQDITIHTIDVGDDTDVTLMQAIADLTGGTYIHARSVTDLDDALEELVIHAHHVSVEAIYYRPASVSTWTLHPYATTYIDVSYRTATGTGITALSQWTLGPSAPFHQIVLEAVPNTLPPDGTSTAALTATITNIYNQPVQNGTVVTFTTSLGSISPVTDTTTNGIVTGLFTTSLQPGTAIISVMAESQTKSIAIQIGRGLYLPLVLRNHP